MGQSQRWGVCTWEDSNKKGTEYLKQQRWESYEINDKHQSTDPTSAGNIEKSGHIAFKLLGSHTKVKLQKIKDEEQILKEAVERPHLPTQEEGPRLHWTSFLKSCKQENKDI